jgi:hypothetical protein
MLSAVVVLFYVQRRKSNAFCSVANEAKSKRKNLNVLERKRGNAEKLKDE